MNKKPAKMSFRSHGLLMELTIICGFFIAAACIFILVFVKAGQLSARSEDLSAAANAAQTIVENVLPEDGADGEHTYEIYFDENWKQLGTTDSTGEDSSSGSPVPGNVHAAARVTETWTDGLAHIEVVITSDSAVEGELFRLSADRDFS